MLLENCSVNSSVCIELKVKNVSFAIQISKKYGLEKVDIIHEGKPCYNSV
jgi:hypothetical protein